MNRSDELKTDRREAVRTCFRYAAAAGLAGISAGLAVRTLRVPPDDRCPQRHPCRSCSVLADCRLPKAEQARQAESRQQRGS